MALFSNKEKSPLYHAGDVAADPSSISYASFEQLQRWANDPNCIERAQCAIVLKEKIAAAEARRSEHEQRLLQRRTQLLDNPFDPRTEISADARHIATKIVTHLWFLLVGLPIILGLLWQALK